MLSAWAYSLPFRKANGTDAERTGWILRLGSGPEAGWAEACPLPQWGGDDMATTRAALAHALASGESEDSLLALAGLPEAFEAWGVDPVATPVAAAALELTYWDAKARAAGHSLAAELAASLPGGVAKVADSVAVNALLQGESPEAVEAEAKAAVEAGFTAVKLKVGGRDLELDVARAKAARAAVGAKFELRLDANGAWDREGASAAVKALAPVKASFIEQPIAASDEEGLLALAKASKLPIAADESMVNPESARRLIAAGVLGAVVLKPAMLGGLAATAALAAEAKAAGLRVILTGAQDRGLATLAAAHLAAALGLEGPHGFTLGATFDDPSPPAAWVLEQGRLSLSGPGMGLVVRPEIKASPSPVGGGRGPRQGGWGRR